MRKTEFLALLRQKLRQLPPKDVEETLEYYNEMIDDYVESGCSPDEAVAKMGSVDNIAAQILAGTQNFAFEGEKTGKEKKSGLVIVLLILGFPVWFPLLAAAFSILISVAVVIATLTFVVPWVLVISFGASALGLLATAPFAFIGGGFPEAILTFGTILVLTALCIFSFYAGIRLTVLGAKGIAAMFRGFFNLIFRKGN